MDNMNSFMSLFVIIGGVIALYGAVTGKGPAFKNDYPKAMKADADKMMRQFCWFIGPLFTATGVLDLAGFAWAFWISLAVGLPAIIVYIILFRRKFKKHL